MEGVMAAFKKETSKSKSFAEGGHSNHMFGPQAAGSQKPGTTEHDVGGGAPGAKFATGGKGKMFGFSGAMPAQAGITSPR
jgi:hypothetical protein